MRAIAMKKHNFNAHVIVQLNSIVNKVQNTVYNIRSNYNLFLSHAVTVTSRRYKIDYLH